MFELDILVFNWIYNQCFTLGKIFGFGALEGFLMYLILFSQAFVIDHKKVSRK